MAKPKRHSPITIQIDADLAKEYRAAYLRAFGTADDMKATLKMFIARFVEDRLSEEIEFVEEELAGDRK